MGGAAFHPCASDEVREDAVAEASQEEVALQEALPVAPPAAVLQQLVLAPEVAQAVQVSQEVQERQPEGPQAIEVAAEEPEPQPEEGPQPQPRPAEEPVPAGLAEGALGDRAG